MRERWQNSGDNMEERNISWLPPDFKVPAINILRWLISFEDGMSETGQYFDYQCMGRAVDAFIEYTENQMDQSDKGLEVDFDDILAS